MAVKATVKKEIAPKKTEQKKAEIKETAVKKETGTVPAKKETAVKKTVKKAAPKKPAAKKEIKVSAYVEFGGKQIEEKSMIADVKKAWTKSGKKVGDIKSMDLYIKPEEDAVYYVINGTETGSVAF